MGLLLDSFPAPTLNAEIWTDIQQGTVGLVVGVPQDGAYPQNVDDDGDVVEVRSYDLVTVPGGESFDTNIFYEDTYSDIDNSIFYYLGWRSLMKDGSGVPLYGYDVMLCIKPDTETLFQRRTFHYAVEAIDVVLSDPTDGADGGFRLSRSGDDYTSYYYDKPEESWVPLETFTFPYTMPGFIVFGVFAREPTFLFPWVAQT